MICWRLLCVLLVLSSIHADPDTVESKVDPIITCYVSTWATYRPVGGKFDFSNVVPSLCSHLVYAFVGINPEDSSIKVLDPWNDLEDNGGKGAFQKYIQLRNVNKKLKVSLAVGGWNEGSANYSVMAASPVRRKTFISSAVKMLREHGFDGLDLDWEYPTKRGGNAADRENFVLLVKELRQAFDNESHSSGRRWLLTSAIGASPDVIRSAYDLRSLSQHLDYLHIMSYDYHGAWEPVAGVNAPLRGQSDEDELSVEKTLELLLSSGAKKEKLLLGLPFYGHTFIASNVNEKPKLGSMTLKEGFSGPFTKEKGFMGYNEICAELERNASYWSISWDERSSTHYAVRDTHLISYDDPKSIERKVRFGMKKNIAGMMVWSLDTDDFLGDCEKTTGYSKFPLLRTINKAVTAALQEREHELAKNKKDHVKKNNSSRIKLNLKIMFPVLLIHQHVTF
ncbi:hypothetical protein R5R35_006847 [Gryllus longicercus]|uniref:GH18 domain-containing protein n=1 Tax=Gryllus longicercus TaxID=2509291 RepID=A0AAN9V7F4_9ORTH